MGDLHDASDLSRSERPGDVERMIVLGYEEADRLAVGLLVVLVQIILRCPAIKKEIAGVDPPDVDGFGMLVLQH